MQKYVGLALIPLALLTGLAGWLAKGHVQDQRCAFLDKGYQKFGADWKSLPEYPLQNVPEDVQRTVQSCWANNPYGGKADGILLTEARRISSTSYYVAFEPIGHTDILLVFRVDNGDVGAASLLGLL